MLSPKDFQDATTEAYEACNKFFEPSSGRIPGCAIVRPGNINNPRTLAKRFAEVCGDAQVQYTHSIKTPGFGSWLMITGTGKPKIGLSKKQLYEWARKGLSEDGLIAKAVGKYVEGSYSNAMNYRRQSMEVRCILHELGHILLQPHLLSQKTGMSEKVKAAEEEQPWVFALTVLGIMTGEYATYCRKDEDKGDDSPSAWI